MLCECFFLDVTQGIIVHVIYVNPYSSAVGKDTTYAYFKYHFEGHSDVVTIMFYSFLRSGKISGSVKNIKNNFVLKINWNMFN